jgi:hypothetical protein
MGGSPISRITADSAVSDILESMKVKKVAK